MKEREILHTIKTVCRCRLDKALVRLTALQNNGMQLRNLVAFRCTSC
jgi:hypothetical protein